MTENEFVKAVKENSQRVFLIALSFTKNSQDAEDIMQNVFLKLWKYKNNFESKEHIAKWLTVVTSNESKNLLKLYSKRTPPFDLSEQFPLNNIEEKEMFNSVMSLPPKISLVIHLFYYEDLSIKEIAKILKLKESTIKTRLNRGREKLKNLLGGEYEQL